MGRPGASQERLFYSFNLEDHVPSNHPMPPHDAHSSGTNLYRRRVQLRRSTAFGRVPHGLLEGEIWGEVQRGR